MAFFWKVNFTNSIQGDWVCSEIKDFTHMFFYQQKLPVPSSSPIAQPKPPLTPISSWKIGKFLTFFKKNWKNFDFLLKNKILYRYHIKREKNRSEEFPKKFQIFFVILCSMFYQIVTERVLTLNSGNKRNQILVHF